MIYKKQVDLGAGESKQVIFTMTPTLDWVGPHVVTVDGLSGSFTVLEPPAAQFVVSDLIITPATCYPGELVSISVVVKNVGPVAGTYTLTCEVV